MSVRGPGRVVCGGRSRFGGLAWSGGCKQHSIHETGARTDDSIFAPASLAETKADEGGRETLIQPRRAIRLTLDSLLGRPRFRDKV
jgi:hypothetical protein